MSINDLHEKTWHTYVPISVWSLMALCTLPGVVLGGYLLFDAFMMAVSGFQGIANQTIWTVHLMVSTVYLQHFGTFLAIIALLLGSAAVLNMSYDANEGKGADAKKTTGFSIDLIMAGGYTGVAVILGVLAIFLSMAFVIMMAIPLLFVMIAAPLNLLVLLFLLTVAMLTFVMAALPFHRF